MITLFLILCYFILIFNIMVPAISEKLRMEHNVYVKYKKINKDYYCVDDRLFYYKFDLSGITPNMALDYDKNPLTCNKINKVDKNMYISCNSNSTISNFREVCNKAYLNIFFNT
ncbi:MV entry-fusion complex protein [Cotia virus SPAn232]|uniref:MV entry-fusion complex protein n=2 Tax=Cotia virus TaxID=39444 RepID=H6TA99_9POXV|nr:MV entry-fusion complex protein [Cotia virus SPAn232]ADT91140.1 MV entry-fusion complex protein [Cotia virus SPAn232]AIT70744.1 MV entry-fusion complex protein [Cotia virus]